MGRSLIGWRCSKSAEGGKRCCWVQRGSGWPHSQFADLMTRGSVELPVCAIPSNRWCTRWRWEAADEIRMNDAEHARIAADPALRSQCYQAMVRQYYECVTAMYRQFWGGPC